LHPELGLRDIPVKLIQRRGQTQRFRRLVASTTSLDPPGQQSNPDSALATPPASYGDATSGSPAYYRHVAVSQLDYWDGTSDGRCNKGASGQLHDEPSSPSPAQILSCNLGYTPGGSLLENRPGSVSKSAEAPGCQSKTVKKRVRMWSREVLTLS
jgi:hypothetical protein